MVHLQGASGHVSLMAPDTPRGSLRLGNGRELNQGYGRWAAPLRGLWAVGGGLWALGGTPAGAMGTGRYGRVRGPDIFSSSNLEGTATFKGL